MKKLFYYLPILLFVACGQPGNQGTETNEKGKEPMGQKVDEGLMGLFEEVNVVKMHLFGTAEAEPNPDNYPYTGKVIAGDAVGMLGEGLQPNDIGSVYACYYTENSGHFILRVPGKNASSDLVLAKWDAKTGKLMKVADLAYLMCDEGICHQQDAWLADLDDNRTLELIVRKHTRDAQGNVSDESFEVLTDQGMGDFVGANELLASLAVKYNYVMQH